MHRDYQALQQLRSVRRQLDTVKGRANGPVRDAITALDTKLDELEGKEDGRIFLSTPQGRSLAHLNSGLSTIAAICRRRRCRAHGFPVGHLRRCQSGSGSAVGGVGKDKEDRRPWPEFQTKAVGSPGIERRVGR